MLIRLPNKYECGGPGRPLTRLRWKCSFCQNRRMMVIKTMPAAHARRVDVRRSMVGDILSCLEVKLKRSAETRYVSLKRERWRERVRCSQRIIGIIYIVRLVVACCSTTSPQRIPRLLISVILLPFRAYRDVLSPVRVHVYNRTT